MDESESVVRFERTLSHPRGRVWAALIEPQQLREWFISVLDYDHSLLTFAAGARLEYVSDGHTVGRGEVTTFDPPSVLEYTWDDEILRWELHEDGDGTRLVFTNVVADAETAAIVSQGWTDGLDRLAGLLERTDD